MHAAIAATVVAGAPTSCCAIATATVVESAASTAPTWPCTADAAATVTTLIDHVCLTPVMTTLAAFTEDSDIQYDS
jgi:hypothetical protein